MKLEASDIGTAFTVADYNLLKQHAEHSLTDFGGHRFNPHSYKIEEIEDFLLALNKLFPDCSYSRPALLEHAATESETGYVEALQHTFDLIDNKFSRSDSDVYNTHRFAILFAVAYKFSVYEDGAVDNKPGFFFVMRVAENVNNRGGSYGGYVGRMINYVSSQILEHQEILRSQAEINQSETKPKPSMGM